MHHTRNFELAFLEAAYLRYFICVVCAPVEMIPFQPKLVLDDEVGFCVGRPFFAAVLDMVK